MEERKKELKPTDKFKNMMRLKEFTMPEFPAILTAGDKDSYNSMTIGWGTLGVIWRRPTFTVYVKPERYTYEFIEKSKYFTVSIIDKQYMKGFPVYGNKSGRDVNKEKESGYHIKFLEDGGITFEEAKEVFVCKIICKTQLKESDVDKEIIQLYEDNLQTYISTKPHAQYIGEIIGHYTK